MKKYFKPILLLVILIIFPLISWYYLKGGIEFRREALSALEPKETVESLNYIYNSNVSFAFPSESYRVNTLFLLKDNQLPENIKSYYNQFKNTEEVAVFVKSSQSELLIDDLSLYEHIFIVDSLANALEIIANDGFNVFLIDNQNRIRNYYRSNDENSMQDLVTHTAVLLPPTQKREITRRSPREL